MSIEENLRSVLQCIEKAKIAGQRESANVRLVAVSKTKPAEAIIEAYNAGQRHFGENYVQELEEKANSELIKTKCPDIKWHFIGHLQSNKAKQVAAVPNLYCIETVDSIKLADRLNNYFKANNGSSNVMIQVNTSNEEQKSGVEPAELESVFKHIKEKCTNLNILGLMTIGSYEQSTNSEENKDFKNLMACRDELASKLSIDPKELEISMGMSHDYEQAIRMGSTNIRVGSLIFGSR